MLNNVPTNCCNCGAVMEYSKQHYGEMYKCPYCGTEHHIDGLGRIEEYKVKLMWQGSLIEAWLQTMEMELQYVDYRTLDDRCSYVERCSPLITLTFSGHIIDK